MSVFYIYIILYLDKSFIKNATTHKDTKSMLPEVIQEWNQAVTNQQPAGYKDIAPGKRIYQKTIVTFRGAKIEITLVATDDSAGIDVDQPDSFVRRMTVLETMKNINVPQTLNECSVADVYAAILEAINPESDKQEYEAIARNHAFKQPQNSDYIPNQWKASLNECGAYTQDEVDSFINYCTTEMSKRKAFTCCDKFVKSLIKYKDKIISKTICKDQHKTEQDVFYDEISFYLSKQLENTYGVKTIPAGFIKSKADEDLSEKPSIAAARNLLNDIWTDCEERGAVFCFILNGLALYYEQITKESAAFRYASIKEQHDKARKYRFIYSTNRPAKNNTNATQNNEEETKNVDSNNTENSEEHKKFKQKKTAKAEPIEFVPLGNDMFSKALENAKPLK